MLERKSSLLIYLFTISLIILVSILFQCQANKTPVDTLDPFYANIDSSTVMICRINGSPFYGEIAYGRIIEFHSGIYLMVEDTAQNVGIQLSSSIYDTVLNFPFPYADRDYITYQGNTYYLLFYQPYKFSSSVLSDTHIEGTFFGQFFNPLTNDTVSVQNGYFRAEPDLPYEFYLSCTINGNFFETHEGRENFYRKRKYFSVIDHHFRDSSYVRIGFTIGSITENFIRTIPLWEESLNAHASFRYIRRPSEPGCWAFTGFIQIKELETVYKKNIYTGEIQESIEVSKASFEFEAEDKQGNRIKVTDGQYSLNGFR
jgi:hypothetical protein